MLTCLGSLLKVKLPNEAETHRNTAAHPSVKSVPGATQFLLSGLLRFFAVFTQFVSLRSHKIYQILISGTGKEVQIQLLEQLEHF